MVTYKAEQQQMLEGKAGVVCLLLSVCLHCTVVEPVGKVLLGFSAYLMISVQDTALYTAHHRQRF